MINKLTPGSNMRWESSRMFLPEHREALLDMKREQRKLTMPDMDEDQQYIIDQTIAESMYSKSEISLTVYDPFEFRHLVGYVVRVDQYQGRVLVQSEDGDDWIDRGKIIAID